MIQTELDFTPHKAQLTGLKLDHAESRRRVLECIRENPCITAQDIAKRLGIGINCVSGRICEMSPPDGNLIVACGYEVVKWDNRGSTRRTKWKVNKDNK